MSMTIESAAGVDGEALMVIRNPETCRLLLLREPREGTHARGLFRRAVKKLAGLPSGYRIRTKDYVLPADWKWLRGPEGAKEELVEWGRALLVAESVGGTMAFNRMAAKKGLKPARIRAGAEDKLRLVRIGWFDDALGL